MIVCFFIHSFFTLSYLSRTMTIATNFSLVLVATSLCLSSLGNVFVCGFAAVSPPPQQQRWQRTKNNSQTTSLFETSVDSEGGSNEDSIINPAGDPSVGLALKRDLLQLAASYDRGYGATKRANDQADSLISKLEAINTEQNAIRGVEGDDISPLTGSWRMVWTTAADVLTLSANPLVTVGAIYQVFDLPCVTNVIDFLPPFQTLIGNQLGSLIRAKVTTRAYRLKNDKAAVNSNKIGLDFESVAVEPVELLGNDVGFLPPLGFNLPKVPIEGFEGFFDVTFLDEEILIIRQNAPGGLFVLAKVDNADP